MPTLSDYEQFVLSIESTRHFTLDDNDRRLLHALFGVVTEAGELTDAFKKHLFYGAELDRINLVEECGDLLWYLVVLLSVCGSSLEECIAANVAKLTERYPNQKFESSRALSRDLPAERSQLEEQL